MKDMPSNYIMEQKIFTKRITKNQDVPVTYTLGKKFFVAAAYSKEKANYNVPLSNCSFIFKHGMRQFRWTVLELSSYDIQKIHCSNKECFTGRNYTAYLLTFYHSSQPENYCIQGELIFLQFLGKSSISLCLGLNYCFPQ